MKTLNPKQVIKIGVALCLVLFPLLFMVGFALHFKSIPDALNFELKYVSNPASDFMKTLTERDTWRLFTLPHIIPYLGVITSVPAFSYLAYLLFKKRPWMAIIGGSLCAFGSLFFSAVFAIWLSFTALSNLKPDQITGAIPALENLMKMQGALNTITMLAFPYFIGLFILITGLFLSRSMSRWAAGLVILGILIFVAFIDLDNWMFIGALFIFVGLLPMSLRLFQNTQPKV